MLNSKFLIFSPISHSPQSPSLFAICLKFTFPKNVYCCDLSLGTGKETEETNLLQHLSDCCLVVDALESSVREEVVNNFCSRELTSYEQIFEGAGILHIIPYN